ncbi:hypothetical protein K438DRAFT_59609 [Mycena galopus ATCC 62051]|nr:hypothetical protein K438DRAFT_59609 [Mycena galopus ATCC 62051]
MSRTATRAVSLTLSASRAIWTCASRIGGRGEGSPDVVDRSLVHTAVSLPRASSCPPSNHTTNPTALTAALQPAPPHHIASYNLPRSFGSMLDHPTCTAAAARRGTRLWV